MSLESGCRIGRFDRFGFVRPCRISLGRLRGRNRGEGFSEQQLDWGPRWSGSVENSWHH